MRSKKIEVNGRGELAQVFGGWIVVEDKPLFCGHCDDDQLAQYKCRYSTAPIKELLALLRKRTAKIVRRKWADRMNWGCHSCGRKCN